MEWLRVSILSAYNSTGNKNFQDVSIITWNIQIENELREIFKNQYVAPKRNQTTKLHHETEWQNNKNIKKKKKNACATER